MKQLILGVKKRYALPVYDRENIHLIEDEDLVWTTDDQLFFETLVLEIRGKCISYASYKKKESFKLEKEILSDIKQLENNLMKGDVYVLEQKSMNCWN